MSENSPAAVFFGLLLFGVVLGASIGVTLTLVLWVLAETGVLVLPGVVL